MSSSKYTRIEALENKLAWDSSALSLEDYTKWFLMFTENQGTGYALPSNTFKPEDWEWFKKNEKKFYQTGKEFKQRKILI